MKTLTNITGSIILCMLLIPSFAGAMIFPGTSWTESTPEDQGVDSTALNNALANIESSDNDGTKYMCVIRNGYLIWKGTNITTKILTYSVTKSFTSTVLGKLIDEGKCSLDTYAADEVLLNLSNYTGVKLKHLTKHMSGYDAVGSRWSPDNMDGSLTPLVPTTPLFIPGTMYEYFDDAMNLFGYVLTVIAGQDLETYFNNKIASKIGMADSTWDWEADARNEGYDWSNPEEVDVKHAAAGMEITPESAARFGHLFLNDGNWDGTQVISSSWVEQATMNQVPKDTPMYSPDEDTEPGHYGYNWWVKGEYPNGDPYLEEAPSGTYGALGVRHNIIWVVPAWNMVVVRLGTINTHWTLYKGFWNDFFEDLTPGISYPPIPDIKANGSQGPVDITPEDTLSVTIELDPGDYPGYPADWWVLADSPYGWYYYDLNGWSPGQSVTYQGGLFNLAPYEVLNESGLPIGGYTFYFGVDGNMNGAIDSPLRYDSVEVSITP